MSYPVSKWPKLYEYPLITYTEFYFTSPKDNILLSEGEYKAVDYFSIFLSFIFLVKNSAKFLYY